ncbi:DUF7535 family protein [Halopelagius longus]|uniref:Uncharacterized protein n=1 Tax=Halopelagius longus TaxID=1236180 RepID=A0A1H0YHI8_9EURY|nr:hypothetical protein [Halopelagius longus]SDQ14714.1 hypothetical protein SAMN05216278_0644 [Halopelagius longus]
MTRAVRRPRTDFTNVEMSTFGYLIFGITVVVMLPLLPVLLLLWVGEKLSAR